MNIKKMARYIVTSLFAFVYMLVLNPQNIKAADLDADTIPITGWTQGSLYPDGTLNKKETEAWTSNYVPINGEVELKFYDGWVADKQIIVSYYDESFNHCAQQYGTMNYYGYARMYAAKFYAPYLPEDVRYFRVAYYCGSFKTMEFSYASYPYTYTPFTNNGTKFGNNWVNAFDNAYSYYDIRDLIDSNKTSTLVNPIELNGKNQIVLLNNTSYLDLKDARIILYDSDGYSIASQTGVNIPRFTDFNISLRDFSYYSGFSVADAYSFSVEIPRNNIIGEHLGYMLYNSNDISFDEIEKEVVTSWKYNKNLDTNTGAETSSDYFACTSDFIYLEDNATFTVGIPNTGIENNMFVYYYDVNKKFIHYVELWHDDYTDAEKTLNPPVGARYFRLLSNAENPSDSTQKTVCDAVYIYSTISPSWGDLLEQNKEQHEELMEQNEKQHEELLHGFDTTDADDNNELLGNILDNMGEQESDLTGEALNNMNEYTIPNDITEYAPDMLIAFPLVSSLLQSIFDASGPFKIIISVCFTTLLSSLLIGLFKFYK